MNEVLETVVETDDLPGVVTIRTYLKECLKALVRDGECFSGKRPLGNSGWDMEVAVPLVKGGLVRGEVDADDTYGGNTKIDWQGFAKVLCDAIDTM